MNNSAAVAAPPKHGASTINTAAAAAASMEKNEAPNLEAPQARRQGCLQVDLFVPHRKKKKKPQAGFWCPWQSRASDGVHNNPGLLMSSIPIQSFWCPPSLGMQASNHGLLRVSSFPVCFPLKIRASKFPRPLFTLLSRVLQICSGASPEASEAWMCCCYLRSSNEILRAWCSSNVFLGTLLSIMSCSLSS